MGMKCTEDFHPLSSRATHSGFVSLRTDYELAATQRFISEVDESYANTIFRNDQSTDFPLV
jgi:hypothetical protein